MLLLTLALATPAPVAIEAKADEFVVPADDWARPRSGERVAALPSVRAAVNAWLDADGVRLVVLHPGGETGALWGAEMRDWLVALGVAPTELALRAGSPRDDAVVLRLERAR
ncbi:MAG: hypothetical protein LC632_03855 [Xanthomonadaceae bacterium]|nr:hypothetical protein [Xanthomonadaceae bacterium]